jgi:glycosyltransferase involved in cell wall biosynthesis
MPINNHVTIIDINVLVTIVTPSYNQGDFIEATILSVLNQTYPHIQYIIIDGGSTDHTMQVVDKYRDRIDVIVHERDKGQSDAINKGFKLAKGELAGWLNSDDVLKPQAVQKIVELYQANNATIIMPGQLDWINELGDFMVTKYATARNSHQLVSKDYDIVQPGSFYKLSDLKKVNYCNETMQYCMDLDLILRLLRHGDICFIDEALANFRIHTTSKTTTGRNLFLNEIWITLRDNGMSIFSKNSFKLQLYMFKNFIKNALGVH